jgi:RAQPRD family integrative conjugative element protein
MSTRPLSPSDRHRAPGLSLALLLTLYLSGHASADDATPEHARLAAALRQLDSIERLVAHLAAQPHNERARYYFDYARLSADLERMRVGIRDYLSPSRAQPRDPTTLFGDYRQSVTPPPEAEAAP